MIYKFKYTMNWHGQNYQERYAEVSHKNEDVAKENLVRIAEHYAQYKGQSDEHILNSNQDKPWFVKEEKLCVFFLNDSVKKYQIIDESQKKDFMDESKYEFGTFIDNITALFYIRLLTDDREEFVMRCPWCNTADKLNSFEIEKINPELKVTF